MADKDTLRRKVERLTRELDAASVRIQTLEAQVRSLQMSAPRGIEAIAPATPIRCVTCGQSDDRLDPDTGACYACRVPRSEPDPIVDTRELAAELVDAANKSPASKDEPKASRVEHGPEGCPKCLGYGWRVGDNDDEQITCSLCLGSGEGPCVPWTESPSHESADVAPMGVRGPTPDDVLEALERVRREAIEECARVCDGVMVSHQTALNGLAEVKAPVVDQDLERYAFNVAESCGKRIRALRGGDGT